MAENLNYAVIIPAYNESSGLKFLLPKINKLVENVIVVDDGSSDNTKNVAEQNKALVLTNEKNEGKGSAIIKGIVYALENGFQPVIIMDADGQHPPDLIMDFIKKYNETNADIIIGNRVNRKNMPFIRFLVNMIMSKVQSFLIGINLSDTQCGYRLYAKKAMEIHRKVEFEFLRFEYESEILLYAKMLGLKIVELPIPCVYLKNRKSKISPISDTLRWFRFLLNIKRLKEKNINI